MTPSDKIAKIEKLRRLTFLKTYVKNPSILKASFISTMMAVSSDDIYFFWIDKINRYGVFVNQKTKKNEPRANIKSKEARGM